MVDPHHPDGPLSVSDKTTLEKYGVIQEASILKINCEVRAIRNLSLQP
jgi:hypothetical protein